MPREYYLNRAEDGNGQPIVPFPSQFLNNAAKALEELSFISVGILCDGEINDREALFFKDWVNRHQEFSEIPWFSDIKSRLKHIFQDGGIDDTERAELKGIMESLRGGADLLANYSSNLPLNIPAPQPLLFEGRLFCITGKFAFGNRTKVAKAISLKGGIAFDTPPTHTTHYLVIGKFSSRDWISQSYGRKIERGVELRSQGYPIEIIAEDHWRTFI